MKEVIAFKKEKETKNTVRYEAVPNEGEALVVTTLYAEKSNQNSNRNE